MGSAQKVGHFNLVNSDDDNQWHVAGHLHGLMHKFLVHTSSPLDVEDQVEDEGWVLTICLSLVGLALIGFTIAVSHFYRANNAIEQPKSQKAAKFIPINTDEQSAQDTIKQQEITI